MVIALLLVAIGFIVLGFSVTVFMLKLGVNKMSELDQATNDLATTVDQVIGVVQTEVTNMQQQIAALEASQADPAAVASIKASTVKLAALLPPPASTEAPAANPA